MVDGILDEALARLARTGPEWGGGLSNHGPMAAEALVALGRSEEVEPWLDGYLRRLDDRPGAGTPVDDATWREALGVWGRVSDWEEYLHRQFAEAPWREVLNRWWPRLLPGIAAGATHGVIRTAHAARSLAAAEAAGPAAGGGTVPATRTDELARGLAYWAARYFEVPSVHPAGTLPPDRALAGVPTLHTPIPSLISDRVQEVAAAPGFVPAVAALRPPGDIDTALAGLTGTSARILLDHGRARHIAFIHAVTAPTAVRSILPLLPADLHRPSYEALWLTAAALYAGYRGDPGTGPLPVRPPVAPADLTDRAVANGDEHAIKLTEACLREWRQDADPVYLQAADATLRTHFPADQPR